MTTSYESYEELLLIFLGMLKLKIRDSLPEGVTLQYYRDTPMGPMIKVRGLQHFFGIGGVKIVHRYKGIPYIADNTLPLGMMIQEDRAGAGYYQIHLPQLDLKDLACPTNDVLDKLVGVVSVAVMKFIEKLAGKDHVGPNSFPIPQEYGFYRTTPRGELGIHITRA